MAEAHGCHQSSETMEPFGCDSSREGHGIFAACFVDVLVQGFGPSILTMRSLASYLKASCRQHYPLNCMVMREEEFQLQECHFLTHVVAHASIEGSTMD